MEDDPDQIPDHKLGKLQFSVDYDFQKAELSVGVIQASDLPGVDMSGSTDPYVKIYIVPNIRKRYETKVHRRTLNPVFNETFCFKVKYEVIASKTLVFAIYDFDRFSAHDLIGMVKIKLCDVDLGRVLEDWRDILPSEPDDEKAKELGEICFSLTYVPSSGKLSFVIVEAKNLKKIVEEKKQEIFDDDSEEEVVLDLKAKILQQVMEKRKLAIATAFDKVNKLKRVKTDPDPFVKITLNLPEGLKLKHKTTTKRATANPYYNESVSFDITMEQVQKLSCAITVVDHERIGIMSDAIGRVTLGCNASGNELRHWSDMLANPRRSIAQWHKLVEPPIREYLK